MSVAAPLENLLPTPSRSWRSVLALVSIAACPALLLLLGSSPSWAAFAGRFHVLTLHFPVALLPLALLLEVIFLCSRGRLREPGILLLFLGTLGTVLAMALGWLLRDAEDVRGPLVDAHQQAGVATAISAVVALGLRLVLADRSVAGRWAYRTVLAATCGLLAIASHDGGSLTHGENYLREKAPWYVPPPRAAFIFPVEKPVADWDIFGDVVTPILEARCIDCHQARNKKGGLLLDNWANLQRGSKSGPTLLAGQPDKSLLWQRMALPLDHPDHMPPRREPQPAREEVALLRRWIALSAPAAGTLGELKLDKRSLAAVKQLPELLRASNPSVASQPGALDSTAIAKLRSTIAVPLSQAQAKFPGILDFTSRESADLELNAALLGPAFNDAALASTASLHERITWADFSGTAITDRSGPAMAQMKNLRLLRLARTAVTDQTIASLAGLKQLESLNILDTAMSPDSVALQKSPVLKRIYPAPTAAPEIIQDAKR